MDTRARLYGSLVVVATVSLGCSGKNVTMAGGDVRADVEPVVAGAEDESRDTSVLGVRAGQAAFCAGALVASDVLLTARHCVDPAPTGADCSAAGPSPATAPSSIQVFAGEIAATALFVAQGRALVVPAEDDPCTADIALVLLDRPIAHAEPLEVSRAAVVAGEHLRSVGFGLPSGATGLTRILREHVPVLGQTATELVIQESSCGVAPGGPALDESTGAIVGVFSRTSDDCDAGSTQDVFTSAGAFWSLVETALQDRFGPEASSSQGVDAGAHALRLATDYGQSCASAVQCAAGVCVEDGPGGYCSRTCDGQDKCPTAYGCVEATNGAFVCVLRQP